MDLLSQERFWSSVDKTSGCWIWIAYVDRNCYGVFKADGLSKRAHRIAFELANGVELTATDIVRHKCDSPPCVNPAHLEVGTHQDNVADRVDRGRTARGEGNGRAKLTDCQVGEIRGHLAHGMGTTELARRYAIDRKVIFLIKHGNIWKHVPAFPAPSREAANRQATEVSL